MAKIEISGAVLFLCSAVSIHAGMLDQVALSDAFDDRPIGALATDGGWTTANPTSLNTKRRLEVLADSGDLMGSGTTNQILFFQNIAASPNQYKTTLTADGLSTSSVMMVSFDFYEPSSTTGGLSIFVGTDPSAANPANAFILADGAVAPSGSYTLDAVHHLDAVFNESGTILDYEDPAEEVSSLDSGLMDIWIDNVRVAAGATLSRDSSPSSTLSSLFLTSDGGNQDIYLDNVVVSMNGAAPPPPPPPPPLDDLLITNLTLSAGMATVAWNKPSDHYIVVSGEDLLSFPAAGTVEISETTTSNNAALFPYDAGRGFFQVMLNVATNGSISNPVLRDVVKEQSAANAPTNRVYDVDLEGIAGMTLPGQDVAVAELGGLSNLDKLSLAGSGLTVLGDLSPVAGLTWLNLSSNQLTSVVNLAALSGLEALDLQQNQIADLSGIESLIHLRWLDLENNQISDLALVVTNAANGGLGEGDELWVRGNPLSASTTNQIQILETNYSVRVVYE
jgi:hypothetical protein